jgi:hypothetical protein
MDKLRLGAGHLRLKPKARTFRAFLTLQSTLSWRNFMSVDALAWSPKVARGGWVRHPANEEHWLRTGRGDRLPSLISLLVLCLSAGLSAHAQRFSRWPASDARVDRGAYLQELTPNSVVVRWRTFPATQGVIWFGPGPAQLNERLIRPGRAEDHLVRLSGLQPNTIYYYAVGTENHILQSGPNNYFVTAPLGARARPIRVWVLGDPGTGSDEQVTVRNAYYRFSGARQTDLVLALGDNAYSRGLDRQYQWNFFRVYEDLFKHVPIWPTLGNHDARSADSSRETGVYYNVFTLPRRGEAGGVPSGTPAYYAFDYGPVHFVCLNSEDSDRSPAGPMLTWLKRDLAANHRTWTIAYWHQCPYSKGSHDSDSDQPDDQHMVQMRENALPILESAGVDLVLCGHTHLYERSYLLHGHYGKSISLRPEMILDGGDGRISGNGAYHKSLRPGSPGTVYVNAGSAGHATRVRDLHGLNHPAMRASLDLLGSVVLDVGEQRLDATFLDDRGAALDVFTIIKAP